ncbi:MAG: hypothetical protein ACLS3Y_02445, partial [Collinsella sp.]
SDAIRALGMRPKSCTLDYEEGEEPTFEPEPAPVAQEPAPAANTAVAPAEPVAAPVAAAESDAKPALDSAAGLDILAPAVPAQVEDETADEDYDEYPQRVSYESDTDFSAELPSTTPHADIASAFSSIGASASSFFKGAFAKGRSSSTTLRKNAPLPARPPSGRPSPSSRPPGPSVSVRHRSSSRARPNSRSLSMSPTPRRPSRLRSRHPLTLPRLRRP